MLRKMVRKAKRGELTKAKVDKNYYGRRMRMEIKKNRGEVKEMREKEGLAADVARQSAIIDYIAMMTDTDLPEEGGGNGDE